MNTHRKSLHLLLALLLALLTMAAPRRAAGTGSLAASETTTFVVTVVGDYPDETLGNGVCAIAGGGCTLRAAIQEANIWPGDDTITFSPAIPTPTTFTLTRVGQDANALYGDLDITSNITITGAGAVNTIVDGNGTVTGDRVFEVLGGAVVVLSGITIRNGGLTTSIGGGIRNAATLTLTASTVSGNYIIGGVGGGIYNDGTLTLTASTVSGNYIFGNFGDNVGGGIYNAGTLTLTASTVSGNGASLGGGIYSASGRQLTISGSQISSNRAVSFDPNYGGGIVNRGELTMTNSIVSSNVITKTGTLTDEGGGGLANFSTGSATLTNVTFSGNSSNYFGGGIHNTGTLTLTGSTVSDNRAEFGGGLHNAGALTLTASTLSRNRAYITGGGLYNDTTGTISMTNVTVSANDATYAGGLSNSGTVTLTGSTVSGNTANYGGGGIYNYSGGTVTLTGSTVSGNTAQVGGGGIFNRGSWFARNTTLSGNRANVHGGGAFNEGTANLYSVTFAQNRADADANGFGVGGGIYNNGGTFNVRNNLIATNYRAFGFTADDCWGSLASYGGLRISTTSGCSISGAWGLVNPASIGPVADNGGPTRTHALLPGSAAIDAGEPTWGCVDENIQPLPTDQRGGARVVGAWCDVGAFEFGAMVARVYLPLVTK